MENVLVSIIIPLYKTDVDLVQRCVKSLQVGKYQNYEILIIDDGNEKSYAKKLDTLSSNKIKVIHNNRGGLSEARNKGITSAQGEYIAFVDGDDVVSPCYLSTAVQMMKKYDLDIACGGVCFEEANDSSKRKEYKLEIKGNTDVRIFNNEEIYLLIQNLFCDFAPTKEFQHYVNGSVSWKLYRKKIVEQVLFDKEITLLEDRVFNLEVFSKANRVGITDSVWYTYYQYGNSMIHTYKSETLENMSKILKHCLNIVDIYPETNSYACKWYMSNIYTCIYLDLLNEGNPNSFFENRRRFAKWLKNEPWKTIKKSFSMEKLPMHSKLGAFFCLRNMSTTMLLYYKFTSKVQVLLHNMGRI